MYVSVCAIRRELRRQVKKKNAECSFFLAIEMKARTAAGRGGGEVARYAP